MRKIPEEIYEKINNTIYNSDEINWWQPNSPFNLIETILNPVRITYFRKIINILKLNPEQMIALEVGCGGGIMCEEIALTGFQTSGIDPAEKSIAIARKHAIEKSLSINYQIASGENLPFENHTFDVVFCCDVLEHVRDLNRVISEISRVLKKGGIFFYDTINRTPFSWLIVIKIMQDWKYFSVLPDHLHVWDMFIRPRELKKKLLAYQLLWREHRGISIEGSGLNVLKSLHKRAKGNMSTEEFSRECRFKEGRFLQVSYMGYALKI
jgi:2-polyprenyl-6-hydroxyphenyl methylase/3-demethylubiquinone-9 3-methyltransferase